MRNLLNKGFEFLLSGTLGQRRNNEVKHELLRPFRPYRYQASNLLDIGNLRFILTPFVLDLSPNIYELAVLLSDDGVYEFPEAALLLPIWLVLRAVDRQTEVKFNIAPSVNAECYDERKTAIWAFYRSTASHLAAKISLHNRVYGSLAKPKGIREQYVKSRCRDLIAKLPNVVDANEKGRVLERVVRMLFKSSGGIKVVKPRLRLPGEEIDLVLKNSVNRPFWIQLQSPLIFVECKNWSKRVNTLEMESFVGKMRNHNVKLGICVAAKGFTRPVKGVLRLSAAKGEGRVVLLTLKDIMAYIESAKHLLDWLEERIAGALY